MKNNIMIILFLGTIISSFTRVYPITILCLLAMVYMAKKQRGTYYRKDSVGIMNLNNTYDFDKFPEEYVVVNVATTGLDYTTARIIEVGIIKYSGGVVDQFSQLVNPEISIPAEATKITGITTNMVKKKPTIKVVIPEVFRRINGQIVVGYNVSFDTKFLNIAFGRADLLMEEMVQIDVLELVKHTVPSEDITDSKLETVQSYFGILGNTDDPRINTNCDVINQVFIRCMNIRNNMELNSHSDQV